MFCDEDMIISLSSKLRCISKDHTESCDVRSELSDWWDKLATVTTNKLIILYISSVTVRVAIMLTFLSDMVEFISRNIISHTISTIVRKP